MHAFVKYLHYVAGVHWPDYRIRHEAADNTCRLRIERYRDGVFLYVVDTFCGCVAIFSPRRSSQYRQALIYEEMREIIVDFIPQWDRER